MQSQRGYYAVGNHVVALGDAGDVVVAPEAAERSGSADEAPLYLASSMFSMQYSLRRISRLYTLKEEDLGD